MHSLQNKLYTHNILFNPLLYKKSQFFVPTDSLYKKFFFFFKVTLYKRTILHLSLLHFNVQYVGLRYMYSSYIQLLWMYDESQVVWNCSEFMRKHGKCEVSNSRSSPGEKKELMLFHVLSILVRELNLFFSFVWCLTDWYTGFFEM